MPKPPNRAAFPILAARRRQERLRAWFAAARLLRWAWLIALGLYGMTIDNPEDLAVWPGVVGWAAMMALIYHEGLADK